MTEANVNKRPIDARAMVLASIPAALLLAVVLALGLSDAEGPPCLFRTLFHVPCPGCGLTRSWRALLHGNALLSFRYHPLGIPLFVAAAGLAAAFALRGPRAAASRGSANGMRAAVVVTVLLLAMWAVRLLLAYSGSRFFLW